MADASEKKRRPREPLDWETHKFQFSRGISVLRTDFTAREDCASYWFPRISTSSVTCIRRDRETNTENPISRPSLFCFLVLFPIGVQRHCILLLSPLQYNCCVKYIDICVYIIFTILSILVIFLWHKFVNYRRCKWVAILLTLRIFSM